MRWLVASTLACIVATHLRAQAIHLQPTPTRPRSFLGTNSLTLSAYPSSISMQLIPKGQSAASPPIYINTILVNPVLTSLNLYAFFSSPTNALVDNTSVAAIPSSAVYGQMPFSQAATYTAFTQTNPINALPSGLKLLGLTGVAAAVNLSNVLNLRIDLSGLPQLPAGTYVGTLNIQAQLF